jgi:hypothetical protein
MNAIIFNVIFIIEFYSAIAIWIYKFCLGQKSFKISNQVQFPSSNVVERAESLA